MSKNLVILSVLQTCWLSSLICHSKSVYIFGITPSKELVGVQIDRECNGKVIPIPFPVEEMAILKDCKLISYDSSSNVALIERDSGLIQQTALCQNGLYYHKSLLNASSLVYLQDPEGWVLYNGKVTTFALYKSRLYFIVSGEFEDNFHRKAYKAELRMMQSCSECGAPNISDFETLGAFRSPFLFNCSKRIAEIYNSRTKGDTDLRVKSGHTLKITNHNGYLSFFFQIFISRNFSTTDSQFIDLNLYHATEKGTVELLHTEKISKHYGRWKINGVAGLDYKDGELCWSAADRIYCGKFKDQRLSKSRLVLYPGDSVSNDICKGNRPNLLPIVTGISIIDVQEDETTLIFGCYAQWIGLGGTGLLKISSDMMRKEIHPIYVEHDSERLQLGSLFSTNYMANYCEPKRNLPMCSDPNKPLPVADRVTNNNKKYVVDHKQNSNHYSREAQYTIVRAANGTEIGILDYGDLYNSSIIVSKQDRELFDEKGIGKGAQLSSLLSWFITLIELVIIPTCYFFKIL